MLIIVKLLLGTRTIHFPFASPVVGQDGGEIVWLLRRDLLVDTVPDGVDTILVAKSFKDTVASNHEEIKVVLQFETANFWVTDDHVGVSSILLLLRLDIAKGLRHGESAWEDSERPLYIEVFLVG